MYIKEKLVWLPTIVWWRTEKNADTLPFFPVAFTSNLGLFPKICMIAGCQKKHHANGLCRRHYYWKVTKKKQLINKVSAKYPDKTNLFSVHEF